eukprot:TRINITY_DN7327_c0_g1_i1.p2 TRINITY_DN7327_c0_g1~~TRINITY_DN7327_c0_g1_i1.p2  ORF type:complete len:231 (-),score=28.23 TRINITY_DN7327_c0_g1_i1:80-727(-)
MAPRRIRHLSRLRTILLSIFAMVQLVALALALAAIALPEWIDLDPMTKRYVEIDGEQVEVNNAGLWQICIFEIEEGNTADSSKEQITNDNCKSGSIVDDFYKSRDNFGENMYPEFLWTRAAVVLFVVFGFMKLFTILISKCREESRMRVYISAIVAAVLETGASVGALIAYGLILQQAVDYTGSDGSIRDYWSISYQMFLSAGALALVCCTGLCF